MSLRNGSAQRDTIAILAALADDDEQGRELREAAAKVAQAAAPQGRPGEVGRQLFRRACGCAVEVGLAPAAVGDVRVELGRAEVGVAEHLLDAAQVGAALEQVRRERVAQQVGVDAPGSSPAAAASRRRIRNAPERVSGAALRVQEQLGPVAAVEVRAARARGSGAAPSTASRPIGTTRSLAALAERRARRVRRGRRRPCSSPTASETRSPPP